jgi:hypothetical protein
LEYEEETILAYFDDWMLKKRAYKGNLKWKHGENEKCMEPIKVGPDLNWRLNFLADHTYTNLRLGVLGFFG